MNMENGMQTGVAVQGLVPLVTGTDGVENEMGTTPFQEMIS